MPRREKTVNQILRAQMQKNPITNPTTKRNREIKSIPYLKSLIHKGTISVPPELVITPTNRLVVNKKSVRERFIDKGYKLARNRQFKIDDIVHIIKDSEKDNMMLVRKIIKDKNISGNYRVSYIKDGVVIMEHEYDIPVNEINNWWNKDTRFNNWRFDSYRAHWAKSVNDGGTIVFTKASLLVPDDYFQKFSEGQQHCLLYPIQEYFEKKLETNNDSKQKIKIRTNINKAKNLIELYKEGVPQDKLEDISKQLNIAIKIIDIAKNTIFEHRPKGRCFNTFQFINSRLDHVDRYTNASWSDREIVSTTKFNKIKQELKDSKEFFTFTKNTIHTNTKFYSIKEEEDVRDWEETQPLDKMEYFIYPELSEFVRQGNHFGGCFDYTDKPFDNLDKLKHIDHKKSYANYQSSTYYKKYKFTKAPSVFMKLPKNHNYKKYGGYYKIENINDSKVNENIRKHVNALQCFKNEIYSAPELHFYQDQGYTFDIVAGAYAFGNYNIDMIDLLAIEPKRDKDGNKLETDAYKKWAGKQASIQLDSTMQMYGNKKLAEKLAYSYGTDRIKHYDNTITLSTRKDKCYHRSHISGYILSYSRIQILQQLFEIPFKSVRRIVLDGIYYLPDTDYNIAILTTFQDKPVDYKQNIGADQYISSYYEDIPIPEYDPNLLNKHILAIGPGGSGKTHHYLTKLQLYNPLYCAPTNKLIRSKIEEYNLKNYCTWAKLEGNGCEPYKGDVNVIIIDEVSMMEQKSLLNILKKYSKSQIIFCGDPGYQLPTFKGDPVDWSKLKIFTHKFTKLHRCKDPKLQLILNCARDLIDQKIPTKTINETLINQLKNYKGTDDNYTINDYIITGTHERIKILTDKHKSKGHKWLIKNTTKEYCNGDVIIQENKPTNSAELRHAFTAHATQGETIKTKIYIDTQKLFEPQMFYTVLSRAQYMNQIILI